MRVAFQLLCFVLAGINVTAPLAAGSIRIATYNLNNYLIMDRHVGGKWRPSYPKPESEKAILREVIHQAAPDILAVQEIGGLPFLEELRSDLSDEGLYYPYITLMQAADSVRYVAVLSKFAPTQVVKHQDLNFKYQASRETVRRGLLEVSFTRADSSIFKLFVVHLKSRWSDVKADPESQQRRTREAEACRDRIIERTYAIGMTDFLIAGDFNDHPASAPLRRFYSKGALNIGGLVHAVDTRGEQWTHFYRKQVEYSLVDGFIVSGSLADSIEGSGHVVDLPNVLAGSDHRMVYVDLEIQLAK
jgi:predicted extracellular nuclease